MTGLPRCSGNLELGGELGVDYAPREKADFGGFFFFVFLRRIFSEVRGRQRTSLALGMGSSLLEFF
jgi:hypothetical protein